jgi:predicted ATPase
VSRAVTIKLGLSIDCWRKQNIRQNRPNRTVSDQKMRTLEKLTIKNFKSIGEQTLELGRLNVFIGANGAGKSNLIEVFRFFREMVNRNLGQYVAIKGGASVLLHFGRKKSPLMSFKLEFEENVGRLAYDVSLHGTDDDALWIRSESGTFFGYGTKTEYFLGPYLDSREAELKKHQSTVCRHVYHFHDTSETAAVKATGDLEDNRFLRPQAENLAAFLYWMQQKEPAHFANVQGTIRQIAPFFDGFDLAPSKLNENKIRLEWKEKGSDAYFNASSLSDGTLRFICLATLLLQPELPPIVLLDEPELGLHPAAITLLADLLASAATRSQVIVATQSVTLVNQLEPESLWTVEREGNQSVFKHLSEQDMSAWLDDYSLGELWEKNVLGARP